MCDDLEIEIAMNATQRLSDLDRLKIAQSLIEGRHGDPRSISALVAIEHCARRRWETLATELKRQEQMARKKPKRIN